MPQVEISKKKVHYPVNANLHKYLKKYGREARLPVTYDDLLRYNESFPLIDRNGNDTLWESTVYDQGTMEHVHKGLTKIYSLLKSGEDPSITEHLYVSRIDYCTFGNSHPFRVRVVNQFNDNYDYFYVKKADSSRIYGLELEHILSPSRISYLVNSDTLIEEHIAGVPGDDFIKNYLDKPTTNKVRIAKEFVKFNERCFVRLLGDMRSYNYVLDITPDFEDEQYRIRVIDFDQQSYEGKRKMYLPQFFKENNAMVELVLKLLNKETIIQYQNEEKTLMIRRYRAASKMLHDLIDCMCKDTISTPEKTAQLKVELAEYHNQNRFLECKNMGEVVKTNLIVMLSGSGE